MRRLLILCTTAVAVGAVGQDSKPLPKTAAEASPIPPITEELNLEEPPAPGKSKPAIPKADEEDGKAILAPILSEGDLKPITFRIPAPRGLITDRNGKPLAQTVAAPHYGLYLREFAVGDTSPAAPIAEFLEALQKLLPGLPIAEPTAAQIEAHWTNRRDFPIVVTGPVFDPKVAARIDLEFPQLKKDVRYFRYYPGGPSMSHIIGYVRPEMPEQFGPLAEVELRWPKYVAESGLEISQDKLLAGTDGEVNQLFDAKGNIKNRVFSKRPRLGKTIVTSINLDMQQLAYRLLEKEGRPGAIVAVDAIQGDILTMVTYPSYNAQEFVDGISQAEYSALRDDPKAPLFNRAYQGSYPPGSTFKAFTGLASLESGTVFGTSTLFSGPPYLEIDGRRFHNWNEEHEGTFDLRYALMRSSNTWFYRAAILTGSRPVIETASSMGFGRRPEIPLANVAAGNLPPVDQFMGNQAIANMSIGQGTVQVSPLQLASAMGGLANGFYVAEPRLILQEQDPLTNEPIGQHPLQRNFINYRQSDIGIVRAGMWGVVNHKYGTGKRAETNWPKIHGKTGTSQWSTDGEERPLVWFAGFAGAGTPRIAFAVMLQGQPGEKIFGGTVAAPIAGEFMNTVFKSADQFGIGVPPVGPDPAFTDISVPTEAGTGGTVMMDEVERRKTLGEEISMTEGILSDEAIRQMVDQRSYGNGSGESFVPGEKPPLVAEPLDTPESRNEEEEPGVVRSIIQIFQP